RGRLHQVVLGPRNLAAEELLPALVVDARKAAIELRERDELRFAEARVGHVAPVELVEPRGELRAALERMTAARATAPGIPPPPRRGRPLRPEPGSLAIRADRNAFRSCADSPSRGRPRARRATRARRLRRRPVPKRRVAAPRRRPGTPCESRPSRGNAR